jgi:hypothetical protein
VLAAVLVFTIVCGSRFTLVVTPRGAVCIERIFLVPSKVSVFSLNATIDLADDFWGPLEGPTGVSISDGPAGGVRIGPWRNVAAQRALLETVSHSFEAARDVTSQDKECT